MALNIVAAVAANRVIGRSGELPWRLSDDLKWFKELTIGKIVVQGHTTLCSIIRRNHKPLPNRQNIVLTHHPDKIRIDGVEVFTDFEQVLELAKSQEVFVIGGQSVYELALPKTKQMFITSVLADVDGDTLFPEWKETDWWLVGSSPIYPKDDRNDHDFVFQNYLRVKPASG